MIIPNLIIAGTPKSGSTSLHQLLSEHPDICMSMPKEPGLYSTHWRRENNEWQFFFPSYRGEKIVGESSVGYFINKVVPERIYQLNPATKFIFILRNPVDRMFSHYQGRQRKAREFRTFSDAIRDDQQQYLFYYSFYCSNIIRFLEFFPLENIHIVIFEEYIKAGMNEDVIKQMYDFLTIDNNHVPLLSPVSNVGSRIRSKRVNLAIKRIGTGNFKKKMPLMIRLIGGKVIRALNTFNKTNTKAVMKESDRKYLEQIFYTDVKELERLMGRKLPWGI